MNKNRTISVSRQSIWLKRRQHDKAIKLPLFDSHIFGIVDNDNSKTNDHKNNFYAVYVVQHVYVD